MRVADLKAVLESLPDDAHVLVPGRDHSYDVIGAIHEEVVEYVKPKHGSPKFCEWSGNVKDYSGAAIRVVGALVLR